MPNLSLACVSREPAVWQLHPQQLLLAVTACNTVFVGEEETFSKRCLHWAKERIKTQLVQLGLKQWFTGVWKVKAVEGGRRVPWLKPSPAWVSAQQPVRGFGPNPSPRSFYQTWSQNRASMKRSSHSKQPKLGFAWSWSWAENHHLQSFLHPRAHLHVSKA